MAKNKIIIGATVALGCAAVAVSCSSERINPLLSDYNTPFEIPPFEEIKVEDYLPALEEGINQQKAEVEAIINNTETPNFENTIYALDKSGELLTKVAMVFFGL